MEGCPRLPELEALLLGLWCSGNTTVELLLALRVSRHQLLQESHICTLDRRHIVDMCQIGIKSGMKAVIAEEGREKKEDDGENFVDFFRGRRKEEGGRRILLPLILPQTFLIPHSSFLLPRITIPRIAHHLREPDEGEKNRADEKEGTEEAEVAQGGSTKGNEGEESTNGGDITHHKGFDDFLQGLTDVRSMPKMGDEVQGIIDSDAHDDRGDADDDDRHLLMYPRQTGDGKDPPPSYRQRNQQDMPQTAQEEPEQQQNQYRRDTDRE